MEGGPRETTLRTSIGPGRGIAAMIRWLLKTLNVGDELLVRLDQARLTVQRPGVLWVGLALLAPAAYLIFRRQRRNLGGISPALRAGLGVIRVAVLALL